MRVSVCIPTRNRPDDVLACIASIRESSLPAAEILVTDDSTDDRTRVLVRAQCPDVTYLEGPRLGLGANRNNAISRAQGDWILFLDDDARLTPNFLATLQPLMAAQGVSKVIFTGLERNAQELVFPHDQSFLGFQSRAYRPGEPIRTLVMNAAVFPAALLKALPFDSSLVYGYDEIDIAARALARGYTIELCTGAVNLHFSSPLNRAFNAPYIEAARIYVTYRKYRHVQLRPLKAAAFLAVSLAHSVAHHLAPGTGGVSSALKTHFAAWGKIRRRAP